MVTRLKFQVRQPERIHKENKQSIIDVSVARDYMKMIPQRLSTSSEGSMTPPEDDSAVFTSPRRLQNTQNLSLTPT